MGLPRVAVPEYSMTLPSNEKEVKYRPFLVKEEKLLLMAMESEKEDEIMDAIKNVITNCVQGDINIDKLPLFDIEYIFLWLRAKSKGEVIELNYSCPKCKGKIPVSFSVEDIKIHKADNHSNKVELTDDLGIVLNYPDIVLQKKIASLPDDLKEVELIFKTILTCIDYIYDKEKTYSSKDHTEKEMEEFLDSLTDDQFQKLSKFYEGMPKLRHEIKLECKNKIKEEGKKKEKACGYTEDVVLEGLQAFFG